MVLPVAGETGWADKMKTHLEGDVGFGRIMHVPIVSGKSRSGHISPSSSWTFVGVNTAYFYPVYYGETFGVAGFGVHLRGNVIGGTGYLGLFENIAGQFKPGLIKAQTTVALDTAGWKEINITAVNGLAPGWYWHASKFTASLDVFCLDGSVVWLDGDTMENAIRQDSLAIRSTVAGPITGVFVDNPTVGIGGSAAPSVGVKFA